MNISSIGKPVASRINLKNKFVDSPGNLIKVELITSSCLSKSI